MKSDPSGTTSLSRRKLLASAASAVVAACCSQVHASTMAPVWRHVLFTGQSLALGAQAEFNADEINAGANITTSGRTFMVRLRKDTSNSGIVFGPLHGGVMRFQTNHLYQPALGMANAVGRIFRVVAPDCFLVNTAALGASPYTAIKREGTQRWVYDKLIQYVSEAKRMSLLSAAQYSVAGVCICHGETDMNLNAVDGLTEEQLRLAYFENLQEWRSDFSADFGALGAALEGGPLVRMFLYQTSTWRRASVGGTQGPRGNAGVTLAQLDAHVAGTHVIVAPSYAFDHVDHLHLTRLGYQQLGEMYAAALSAESTQAGNWKPLRPLAVTHPLPSQVNVQMQGGLLPYRFEALPVQASPSAPQGFLESYGFSVRRPDGIAIPIVRVVLTGNVLKLFTSKLIPPGSTVSYGLGSYVNNQSMGGNLRDSSAYASKTGRVLRHWCLLFRKAIPDVGAT